MPKSLKVQGVPENQAEIHAEAIAGLIDEQLATKKGSSNFGS